MPAETVSIGNARIKYKNNAPETAPETAPTTVSEPVPRNRAVENNPYAEMALGQAEYTESDSRSKRYKTKDDRQNAKQSDSEVLEDKEEKQEWKAVRQGLGFKIILACLRQVEG